MMNLYFLPINHAISTDGMETILDVARRGSIPLDASCSGKGTCGRCRIRISEGNPPAATPEDRRFFSEGELKGGWRLACRCVPVSDLVIHLPMTKDEGRGKKDLLWFPKDFVFKRDHRYDNVKHPCGIAFDVGTTTVVGMLWDLTTGKLLYTAARQNPQTLYGADVISRILFAMEDPKNIKTLQKSSLNALHDILNESCHKANVKSNQIVKGTIVGNTTMAHLILGIDPSSLAIAPYVPQFEGLVSVSGAFLGFPVGKDVLFHVLPGIAGHVGSDSSAVLLATGLHLKKGVYLAIDIGTNGEILMAKDGRVLACSTAAGPAFEGASIRNGMRAGNGAIEKVRFLDDQIHISVIGNVDPTGICGSGLIDGVAEMITVGCVASDGRLLSIDEAKEKRIPASISRRLIKDARGAAFVLYESSNGPDYNLVISQKDIREVQLAKGAIAAGSSLLMKKLDVNVEDLDEVLLAGAFGNYIDPLSALTVGLLPQVSPVKIRPVGNAAGVGASMALLSEDQQQILVDAAKETQHIDLAEEPKFQATFMKEMYFRGSMKENE